MSDIITQLRDDEQYYGEFGKQYLSNSDIGKLLNNPKMYGVSEPDNVNFAKGRYFHQLILEPQKASEVQSVDVSSRNSKAYKDALLRLDKDFLILDKECREIEGLVNTMMGNLDFFDAIRSTGNVYEEPGVGMIKDRLWKANLKFSELQTFRGSALSSHIKDFKYSAKKYNYDSQCYIYQNLFDKPLVFFVIEKQSGMMGMYRPSDEFIRQGEYKVEDAIEVHDKFFADGAPYDIENYYIKETL